jgi:hypothetical protein
MALIVEDGTGLANADSYVDLVFANDYMARFYPADHLWNDAVDGIDDAAKETHLRRGAQALDGLYGGRVDGYRLRATQALLFPRSGLVDRDGNTVTGVPLEWKQAQVEAARRFAEGVELNEDMDRGGAIKREKIGPIEFEYFDGAPSLTESPQIEGLISRYLTTEGRVVVV